MKNKLPGGRYRMVLSVVGLSLLAGVIMAFSGQVSSHSFLPLIQGESQQIIPETSADKQLPIKSDGDSGTLEKLIVSTGNASLNIDVSQLNGNGSSRNATLAFGIQPDAFFTALAFNGEFRGTLPSSMGLISQNSVAGLPARLNSSLDHLVIESLPWGGDYELAVRDSQDSFTFFNIQGQVYNYDGTYRTLNIENGRLLLSPEFAGLLGRSAGTQVGTLSTSADMRPIEITQIQNGDVTAAELPPSMSPENGTNPGPDVIVGDVSGLSQFESSSTQVGLAIGTDSCNAGTENLDWFALPNNDHPVIPQNLYRMSGGATNDATFEQIGQSSMKHAFTALTNNICGFGCNGVGGSHLGSGCSDPYGAGLNSGPNLGSRAWVNPFTGFYPRGDSQTPPNNHSGHNHSGVAHTIRVNNDDLSPSMNPNAKYFAEAQYVTPHEYAWCTAHPGECNMFNNVSHRRYTVSGSPSNFGFSAASSTVRMQPAIMEWPGATIVQFRPSTEDGIGFIAYKVTGPTAGVWHYEYAIYNENLDRAISYFILPRSTSVNITNIGFHAPPQHPGYTFDGTPGNLGFSNTPWTTNIYDQAIVFGTEAFAQNPNANAIRWGTMYNVRFDSTSAPVTTSATVGFFKTGSPIAVQVMGPSAVQGPPPCTGRRITGVPSPGCGGL